MMVSQEVVLNANLPFLAIVVVVLLVTGYVVLKRTLNIQLGPIKIATEENSEQLNHVNRAPDGTSLEPTLRSYVKSTESMVKDMNSQLADQSERQHQMFERQREMVHTLAEASRRTSTLEHLQRQTLAELESHRKRLEALEIPLREAG